VLFISFIYYKGLPPFMNLPKERLFMNLPKERLFMNLPKERLFMNLPKNYELEKFYLCF